MFLLRNPAEVPITKPTGIVHTRSGITNQFQPRRTNVYPITGLEREPVQSRKRHILSRRTWRDWMTLHLKCLDHFERKETHSPFRSSMNIGMPLAVSYYT